MDTWRTTYYGSTSYGSTHYGPAYYGSTYYDQVALACMCSTPVIVDARKRTKGELLNAHKLQPYAPRLQPYARQAATLCTAG